MTSETNTMAHYSEAHDTFTIERTLKARPAAVFGAWSDPARKRIWFACHDDWISEEYSLDCRAGGHETSSVRDTDGVLHAYRARILDVVADRRLIFSYDMYLDDRRISISLAMVGFMPAAAGTKLIFTEQAIFLDGYDDGGDRRQGTEIGLDKLGLFLHRGGRA